MPHHAKPAFCNRSRPAPTRALELLTVGTLLLFILWRPLWLLLLGLGRLRPGTTHGTARFATRRELRALRSRRSEGGLTLGTVGGSTIALPEEEVFQYTLVVGPPGSGKTSGLFIPNLLTEVGARSLVINDLKGELIERTYAAIARHYEPWIVNFLDPAVSRGYNPLAYVHTALDAQAFAECWVTNTGRSTNEPFWNTAAQYLIAAAVLHLNATVPGGGTLAHLRVFLCTRNPDEVTLALRLSPSPDAQDCARGFLETIGLNERMQSGVFAELPARFTILQTAPCRPPQAAMRSTSRRWPIPDMPPWLSTSCWTAGAPRCSSR